MKLTKSHLKQLIQEVINEVEFHGETPAGQLYGTEKEDAKFTQQLAVEKILKSAGLDREEMNIVFGVLADRLDELDFLDSSAYEKLFQHFAFSDKGESEMPYGVAKARTGDPGHWILNKLRGLGAGPGAEPKSLKNPPQYGGWAGIGSKRHPPGPGRTSKRFRRENKSREKITTAELQKIVQEELKAVLEPKHNLSEQLSPEAYVKKIQQMPSVLNDLYWVALGDPETLQYMPDFMTQEYAQESLLGIASQLGLALEHPPQDQEGWDKLVSDIQNTI